MRRALPMASALCVLALVVTLCGCGGSGGPTSSSVGTAGKPQPPSGGLPPVGAATGSIYYSTLWSGVGSTIRMAWDGSNPTVLSTSAACAYDFEVSYGTANRFLLYRQTVANWPTKDGWGVPIKNIFMVPESGGTPVNIINDDHFQVYNTVCISVDDTMIAISGGGIWSEELQDFTPGSLGSYVAELDYENGNGYPSGIRNLRMVCPYPLGDLSPDKSRAAVTDTVVPGDARADLWVTSLLSGVRTKLTNTATLDETRAAWSPVPAVDRIAYNRPVVNKRGGVTAQDIYTVKPDGTGALCAVTKANSGVVWNLQGQWSPDATQLAFKATADGATGPLAIMRTAADGTTAAANLTTISGAGVPCLKWRP